MLDTPSFLLVARRWVSRHWLSLTVTGLIAIFIFAGRPVWAADVHADINQTVPPATP